MTFKFILMKTSDSLTPVKDSTRVTFYTK